MQEQETSDTEKAFKKERGGGNYGEGTKELQIINYRKKKEREAKRESLFESGLDKFNSKDTKGVHPPQEQNFSSKTKEGVTHIEFGLLQDTLYW